MGCILAKADVEISDQQFRIIKLFAKGGFSQIFLVEELKSKQRYAMKQIDCHSEVDIYRVRREIDVHQRFGSHPNILWLEGFAQDETPNGYRFSLIFNFYKRGSLQDELSRRRPSSDFIDEACVIRTFSEIVSAVSLLHSSFPPIAHRDLKPGNVLLTDDDRPILMDFGSSCDCPILITDGKQSRLQLDEAGELCSMPYRAPELFVCEVGSKIDQSIDIWALGCLLYALCFFRSPFDDIYEKGDSIALAVQSARINITENHPYSPKLINMIRAMIQVEPKERPTIYAVGEMIRNI